MHSESSTFKVKNSHFGQAYGSHLATYQGEAIRKSIGHTQKREKANRRVLTENSEKCLSIGSEMKKIIKQFRLPFKSASPKFRKKMTVENMSTSNYKFCLSTVNTKKKLPLKSSGNVHKINTENGALIKKKKTLINEKQKFEKHEKKIIPFKKQEKKTITVDEKRMKSNQKKMIVQSKSKSNLNLDKLRMKTEGTFDSTPSNLTLNDIQIMSLIGQGTFGSVYKSKIKKTGMIVAVKKVFQDPKYKNRQIQIVNMLHGDFTMKVLGTFTTVQDGNQFLNIVMQFYDGDLYHYIRSQGKKGLSTFDIKLMTYQIFRGILYLHSLKISHRDIKPHNLLFKGKSVAICDFGSAKILNNEPNLPYICSRCYRAPQLIFGATHYTTMIDLWSVGCVILQMINGVPLFIGESSIDHLIQIIKVMGTPTKSQVMDMNPQYDLNDYKFPKIKKKEWGKVLPKADPLLIDLISQIMIYSPKQRLNAAQALAHEFYDQLREQKLYTAVQKQFGLNLFTFTEEQLIGNQHLASKLIPIWFNA